MQAALTLPQMRNTVAYARKDKLVCDTFVSSSGPSHSHLVGTPGTAKNGVVDAVSGVTSA
jgi:hypothetical protein